MAEESKEWTMSKFGQKLIASMKQAATHRVLD
jgi:hypothetical protein